ncbi:uncharacterized protein BYT42DRAFT_578932 [Radiomyces spectabilis]|uniref:uncharacterized protein n=1 Tax=Radiomyces spectabilis TaxID=64574 RepID=UPI00221F1BAC|nr:uncharacterized protein BYT42DRAFT_578932 [Radiomyces spectabilis]KAI8373016.1 hypothetical protein BYT42DRAFT_578932 [Radiomyces spectabilis]
MTLLTLESWLNIPQRSLELAANATADNSIVSGALFIGKDTTDPDAAGPEIFERPENHPVAVSSIIQYSSNASNFHPSKPPNETADSLEDFLNRISTFPGFMLTSSHRDGITHHGNIQTLLEEVNKVYLQGHHKEQKEATNKILSGLLSHQHSDELSYTISHLAIENLGTEADLKLHMLTINQRVGHDKNGMITLTQDNADLNITELTLNRGFLESNADRLARAISRAEIKDVVQGLTTPHCILLY